MCIINKVSVQKTLEMNVSGEKKDKNLAFD